MSSWAHRHPILTGALVGSVVPGVGTLVGALAGVVYDMTKSDYPRKQPLVSGPEPDQPPPPEETE